MTKYIFRVVDKKSRLGCYTAGFVPHPAYGGIPSPCTDNPPFDGYQHSVGHYGFTKPQLRYFLSLIQQADEADKQNFFDRAAVLVFRVASQDIRVLTERQVVFRMHEDDECREIIFR